MFRHTTQTLEQVREGIVAIPILTELATLSEEGTTTGERARADLLTVAEAELLTQLQVAEAVGSVAAEEEEEPVSRVGEEEINHK